MGIMNIRRNRCYEYSTERVFWLLEWTGLMYITGNWYSEFWRERVLWILESTSILEEPCIMKIGSNGCYSYWSERVLWILEEMCIMNITGNRCYWILEGTCLINITGNGCYWILEVTGLMNIGWDGCYEYWRKQVLWIFERTGVIYHMHHMCTAISCWAQKSIFNRQLNRMKDSDRQTKRKKEWKKDRNILVHSAVLRKIECLF